jgi:hypothetical protein
MDRRMTRWLAGTVVACWFAGPAAGRLVESWPYDRLFKEADLVVIAAPAGEEKADDAFGHNPWGGQIVGLNTAFEVRHTLKGEAGGRRLKVLHFRFAPFKPGDPPIIEDGPGFVAFRTKPAVVGDADGKVVLPAPEYLLFLRRLKDGRYEPVSGKVDPKFAVRELSEPPERALGGNK